MEKNKEILMGYMTWFTVTAQMVIMEEVFMNEMIEANKDKKFEVIAQIDLNRARFGKNISEITNMELDQGKISVTIEEIVLEGETGITAVHIL